jgi:CrcB protein
VRTLLLMLVIGFGGALGAVFRHLIGLLFHGALGLPGYVGVMVVNITGCFLIGVCFFLIEAIYNRDVESRLASTSLATPLQSKGWWPDSDPTMPVVREFRDDLTAQLLAGFLITGILGGMTTFSLFSLLSVRLNEAGGHWELLVNMGGTIVLGFLATWLGLVLARWIYTRTAAFARHGITSDRGGEGRSLE